MNEIVSKNDNTFISKEVEIREMIFGRFTACFARHFSNDLRSVVFCSPVSFRDPESSNVWHPYLIMQGFPFFMKEQILFLLYSLIRGMIRFLKASFGKFYFIPPREDVFIFGVAPVIICKPKGNSVETSYCNQDDIEKITWLLADEKGKDIRGYPISRTNIMRYLLKMLFCNLVVSLICRDKSENLKDWLTASILMFNWIISLQWVHMWIFAIKIREIINTVKPEKIYSLHEMHPHARIAWIEAEKRNIPTITVQHCLITRSKLWYFPTDEELKAGLKTPDKFVVFSEKERALLGQFFPKNTCFDFGCGPRFSHWKNMRTPNIKQKSSNAPILFAGSLPWWDNEVVLAGVKKLITESKSNRPVIVRFHPTAKLLKTSKKWIDNMVCRDIVNLSTCGLSEDIDQSSVVIGMNSTVLEEAAFMGQAVIILESNRYLSFATSLGKHVSLDSFNWKLVEDVISSNLKYKGQYIREAQTTLGIEQPVFKVS